MPDIPHTRQLAGVTVRCHGTRTGVLPGCGWVGDSSAVVVVPFGEHRCPKCGGSTTPPLRSSKR